MGNCLLVLLLEVQQTTFKMIDALMQIAFFCQVNCMGMALKHCGLGFSIRSKRISFKACHSDGPSFMAHVKPGDIFQKHLSEAVMSSCVFPSSFLHILCLGYRARWTVRGEPRVPWKAEGLFDGISEFKLDKNGKIYQHKVDNTILSDPPYIKLPILGELHLLV